MRVLVACEFSGIVRDAFIAKGHAAYSCDLLPSERPGFDALGQPLHLQGDITGALVDAHLRWDMIIAFPPCTHLAVSGARWFKDKAEEQAEAIRFVEMLWTCAVPRKAIENPIGVLSTQSKLGKPTQIIHPWQFGHNEVKSTCLWLKGLPKLQPTEIVDGREQRIWRLAPSPDRWKNRSRTYEGIARAFAEQWGNS